MLNSELEKRKKEEKYKVQVAEPLNLMFKDMAKYAPSKLFGLLGNVIIVPIYTNLLSPTQYGLYTIALAVLSFLCIIFSDWVGLSGLRFFRQHQLQDQIPKYLSTLVMLLAVNITSMFVLAFLFRHTFYDFFKIPHKLFFVILILIIPVAIRALLFQILRAQIKPIAFTISTIANQILTIALAVLIIKNTTLGGTSILLAMFISIALIDVILMFQCDIFSYFKCEKPHFETLKCLYVYGIPISIAALSLWAITQSNKFIVSHFNGFEAAGLVGVAYGLTFPILMTLFAIITIAAFPRIINMYEDKTDVRPIISKLTGYFLLISLPVVVVMSLYSTEIVQIFANYKFAEAAIILPYLAFSALFLSFTDYTTMQYHLANKTYINTVLKVFAGIFGVGLNYILIKNYGIIGVGIATLITNILYFVLSVLIKLPKLEWKIPYKDISRIAVAFVPFGLLYYYFAFHSHIYAISQMLLLLIVYYCSYYFIDFVKVKEKN